MRIRCLLGTLVFVPLLAGHRPMGYADENPAPGPDARPAGKGDPKPALRSFEVPWRMTGTKHVMVRAKINGQGPYNFVVDSGAPALFVMTSVCEKLGVKADEKKWGTLDTFEIEGGLKLAQVKVRVEDMFQLEGMNGLGLAGVKLHGVIGYTVLGQYRLEFDFNSDTMTWTELDHTPAPLKPVRGTKSSDLTWVGSLAKGLGAIMGKEIKPPTRRGRLGVELGDTDDGVVVTGVLPKGPAAAAGVRVGDRVTQVRGRRVKTIAEAVQASVDVPTGNAIDVTVLCGGEEKTLTVRTEEGL